MTMLLYAGAAIAILGMLGGIGYSVREAGKDAIRVEWRAANAKAAADAEADRQRQDALRQAQDAEVTRRLSNEKKRTAGLLVSLEAHIKASGAAANCPLTPGLQDAWNRANAGPEGSSPGTMPTGSPNTPPAR